MSIPNAAAPNPTLSSSDVGFVVGDNVLRRRPVHKPSAMSDLCEMLQNATKTVRHEEQARNDLEVELADKKEQLRANRLEVQRLKEEKAYVYAKYEQLTGEREVRIEKHRNEIMTLKKDIARMEHEVNELKDKCHDYADRIEMQSNEITQLTAQASTERVRRESFSKEISDLQEKVRVLSEQKAGVEEVLNVKCYQLDMLKAVRDQVSGSFNQSTIRKELDSEISRCQERIGELTIDLEIRKEVILRLTRASKQNSQERDELVSEINNLRRKYSVLERLYSEDKCFIYSFFTLIATVLFVVLVVSFYALFT